MRPMLESKGVCVAALSPDTVEQAAAHRRRDGLTMTLLADPGRRVIRQFGIVHRRGLVHATVDVFGVPLGVPTGFRELPIPTTLLVDAEGMVRWIDTAADYRIRGDERRIASALEHVFGGD